MPAAGGRAPSPLTLCSDQQNGHRGQQQISPFLLWGNRRPPRTPTGRLRILLERTQVLELAQTRRVPSCGAAVRLASLSEPRLPPLSEGVVVSVWSSTPHLALSEDLILASRPFAAVTAAPLIVTGGDGH